MPYRVPSLAPRRRLVRNDFLQTVLPRGLGDSRRLIPNDFVSTALPPGLGDWRGDVVSLIASKELGQLMSAVGKVSDQLLDAVVTRNDIYAGYVTAKRNLEMARASFGPDFSTGMYGVRIPNSNTVDAQVAYGTASKAVSVFARQVQTLAELKIVFLRIQSALSAAGAASDADAMAGTINQITRFESETNAKFLPAPEYQNTINQLVAAFKDELRVWGVAENAYDDPRWLSAFLKAADKVVPIPGSPKLPQPALDAGLGAIPTIAWVIVGVVGVITAGFVLSSMLSQVIPDQNSKAETARQLLLSAQQQKAKVEAQMRAQGKSQAEIDDAKASIDADTKRSLSSIPDPGSPFGFLVIPGVVAAAGLITLKATGIL